jgi:hypothetical protein
MPSARVSLLSFHGAHSFSGSASHDGFGRVPTIVVCNFFS